MHQNLVPDTFLVLVSSPKQQMHARNWKMRYFEKGLQKIKK